MIPLPRGSRLWLVLLVIGVLSLSLGIPVEAAAASKSAYFRIRASSDYTLYGLIWENELRVSVSPEMLSAVPPIKPTNTEVADYEPYESYYTYAYPEIALSVPKEHLPAGAHGLKLNLTFHGVKSRGRWMGSSYLQANMGLCVRDEAGVEWSYWLRSGCETGSRPRTAPEIQIPRVSRLTLKVAPQQKEARETGIAALVMSGEMSLSDIKRDGASQTVALRVVDSKDKVIKQETGDLSKFGYT
jgi:hypothetical protein